MKNMMRETRERRTSNVTGCAFAHRFLHVYIHADFFVSNRRQVIEDKVQGDKV